MRIVKIYTAVVERDTETGLYVAHVPGIAGAHTQAGGLDELQANLREVLELVLENGETAPTVEFVGIQQVTIS